MPSLLLTIVFKQPTNNIDIFAGRTLTSIAIWQCASSSLERPYPKLGPGLIGSRTPLELNFHIGDVILLHMSVRR